MSQPITYYASGTQIDQLVNKFGSQLNLLNRSQKLELRIILTYLVWGFEQMGEEYTINDAWIDSLQHLMCESKEIEQCLEILQRISVNDAESLLEALQAQCRSGNARLRNAVESSVDDFIRLGVPALLAHRASVIIHESDHKRPRTDDEQALINQLQQMLLSK